jgi:hypothetical protein
VGNDRDCGVPVGWEGLTPRREHRLRAAAREQLRWINRRIGLTWKLVFALYGRQSIYSPNVRPCLHKVSTVREAGQGILQVVEKGKSGWSRRG